jgi:flavodoxin I
MGELYDLVTGAGAEVVGFWPNSGYEFNDSAALDGDDFVGLALDQDNQSALTADRVATWVASIKPALGL